MSINDADQKAGEIARDMHEKDPVARNLAISLDEARAGYARITMRVGDHMVNAYGTTHGGYSFILADTAFGLASNNRGRKSFAQAAHITFMTFGKPGELLTAVAEERSVSGRTGIFDATVYGEDGRVVAEFNGLSRAVKGPSGV